MKKTLLALASLLALGIVAAAQESIERLYSEYGNFSMIRPYGYNNWIIYSKAYDFCDFSLVQYGVSNVDLIHLPENFISISDFEVDSLYDMVYFCGMIVDNVPCMGYFSMSSFPSTTINYIPLPCLKGLKHLELIPFYNGTQVIMTGYTDQHDVIVDVMPNGLGWKVRLITPYIPNSTGYYTCDDMAILDNFVVVTSNRYEVLDNTETSLYPVLWYFTKPTTVTTPISSSSRVYLEVPCLYSSSISIRKCENDQFVIAGMFGPGTPVISRYDGVVHKGAVTIEGMYTKIKSLCYNPVIKSTEVVLDSSDAAIHGSKIYTLYPWMETTPGMALGHQFDGHILKSLCYQGYNPSNFICVGDSIGNTRDLFIYKYLFSSPLGCSELIKVKTCCTQYKKRPYEFLVKNEICDSISLYRAPVVKSSRIETVCESQLKKQ